MSNYSTLSVLSRRISCCTGRISPIPDDSWDESSGDGDTDSDDGLEWDAYRIIQLYRRPNPMYGRWML